MAIDVGTLLQILFWGLYAGCIYILLATGVNLIFGVMKTVNFAHGELLMIGAYVTLTFFTLTGFNPYVLLVATVPVTHPSRRRGRTARIPAGARARTSSTRSSSRSG